MSVQSQTISSQTIASDCEIMMVDYRPMRRGAAILGNVSDFMSGADTNCPEISSGDTAWMMTATAFVLFMTPGLAFFYGGLVPRKSVLTIMMQCLISIAATSIVWAILGFSLAFGETWGGSGFIGNPGAYPLFIGLDMCKPWPGTRIPSLLFAGYQMMFAVIAPALITGAFAERVLFPAYLAFILLWVVLVYCPFAHWIWNPQGFLAVWGVVDFAGGIVVHISAGFAALASVFVVGPRQYTSEVHRELSRVPHNRAFVALGTGMLWMGWFGFNGGSGMSASSRDAFALVNSTLAASIAMVVWMAIEWAHTGKPQLVGACVGAVGGFATITPAAGFVRPWAALLIGAVCAPFCFACVLLRTALGWDDALDVWGVHGMGGLLGSILIGPLADAAVGGLERSALLTGKQVAACAFTLVYAFVLSYLLLRAISLFLPLVPPAETVEAGLDKTIHGEHAYDSDHIAAAAANGLPTRPTDSFYADLPPAGGAGGSISPKAALRAAGGGPAAAAVGDGELATLRRDLERVRELVRRLQLDATAPLPLPAPRAAGPPPPPTAPPADGRADIAAPAALSGGGGGGAPPQLPGTPIAAWPADYRAEDPAGVDEEAVEQTPRAT